MLKLLHFFLINLNNYLIVFFCFELYKWHLSADDHSDWLCCSICEVYHLCIAPW